MTDLRVFGAGATATQPQRIVIGAGETIDEVQANGQWIASDHVVEVEQ